METTIGQGEIKEASGGDGPDGLVSSVGDAESG